MTKGVVMVQVDSDLYLPEWVMRERARRRLVQALKERFQPDDGSISPDALEHMRPNDKVPGIVKVWKEDKQDFLIIPSLGVLTRDEVKDLVGRYTEGGYGKGPEHKSKYIDWNKVRDFISEVAEHRRKRAGKFHIYV